MYIMTQPIALSKRSYPLTELRALAAPTYVLKVEIKWFL